MTNRRNSKVLSARVTAQAAREIAARARDAGMNVGSYIRYLVSTKVLWARSAGDDDAAMLQKIAVALGLDPDASGDEILAAADALLASRPSVDPTRESADRPPENP